MAKKTKKGTGSRVPLSRARVLGAALRMADKGSIAALSMRKLAQGLGVEAMSLYHHVKNKDEILDGLVEIVVSEIEVPVIGGDWKKAMRRRAMSAHDVLLRHPWAAMLLMSRVNIGPAMLRYVDATVGCLLEAGFSFERADRAWNALDGHIYGFTLQELNFPFDPAEYSDVATNYLALIPADEYPHLNAMAVEVIEGRHAGVHDFSFGLELILDGLERLRDGG